MSYNEYPNNATKKKEREVQEELPAGLKSNFSWRSA